MGCILISGTRSHSLWTRIPMKIGKKLFWTCFGQLFQKLWIICGYRSFPKTLGKTIGKGGQIVKQLKEVGKLFAVKLFENDKFSIEKFDLEKIRLEKIAKIEGQALHFIEYFGEYDDKVLVKSLIWLKLL